jgi:hypothetical protein
MTFFAAVRKAALHCFIYPSRGKGTGIELDLRIVLQESMGLSEIVKAGLEKRLDVLFMVQALLRCFGDEELGNRNFLTR